MQLEFLLLNPTYVLIIPYESINYFKKFYENKLCIYIAARKQKGLYLTLFHGFWNLYKMGIKDNSNIQGSTTPNFKQESLETESRCQPFYNTIYRRT